LEPSKSDQEISELLSRACHDVRASTRAVRTHSELLLRGRDTNTEHCLGTIVEGARRIDLLIDALAKYSVALQTESAPFQSIRMDVLLRSVLAKLKKEIEDSAAEVTYGELPRVSGNPERLMQVLENLVGNALMHRGEAPPRIQISAEKEPENWRFAIRDNGPGVEADSVERMFKPFARLDARERGGAGLGLAICRAIVERHGGRIWAESHPGEGTTLYFTLPATAATEPRP